HGLIEAFKATLEEVQEADLLMHVLDISHPDHHKFYDSVNVVLEQLKVREKPVIMVLNKIDKLEDQRRVEQVKKEHPFCIGVSALTGENIQMLLLLVEEVLSQAAVEIDIVLPSGRMDLVNVAYAQGRVHEVKFLAKGIRLKASLPPQTAGALSSQARK